jgi:hypothetical protein
MIGVLFWCFVIVIGVLATTGIVKFSRRYTDASLAHPQKVAGRLLRAAANVLLMFTSILVALLLLEVFLQIQYHGGRFRGNPW